MNPTAEDILNPEKFLREAFGEWEISKENTKYPNSEQRPRIYKAMIAMAREYSLLKSKEAASEAWDVAWHNGPAEYTVKRKETYMKKYELSQS